MAPRVVRITVINDLVCYYCYIGHHELLEAITYCRDTLQLALQFEIEYRPFQLISSKCLPEEASGISRETFFAKQLPSEKSEEIKRTIAKWSAEKNVQLSFGGPMSQTTRAHRLLQKAFQIGGENSQRPLLSALFKSHLEDGQDISDISVLANTAEQVGLMSKEEATNFLLSDELKADVLLSGSEARARGITGVPVTIIDGKWAVNGGQSAETFIQIFKKLAGGETITPKMSPQQQYNSITSPHVVAGTA